MLKRLKINSFLKRFQTILKPDLVDMYRLGCYANKNLVPRNIQGGDQTLSWVPTRKLSEFGLDFRFENQLEVLKKWGKEYKSFFRQIRSDPGINTQYLGEEYLHNNYYPTPDAEVYLSIILDTRPKKIIEVGSGYSTLIARRAAELGNLDTEIEVIDPNPRTYIEKAANKIRLDYIENIPINELNIEANSILFIDSSHICRCLGDIPFIFCQLIPTLPSGVLIHFHDVYLPYDYPTTQQKLLYTENYLLYALLCHSKKYKIVFSSHYMSRKYPAEMQEAISPRVAFDNQFLGASIWIKVE